MNKVSIATKPLVYSTFRYISNHVWHAIGEYVDNSIQSYLDHIDVLKEINPHHKLQVSIDLDLENDAITIKDNAFGIENSKFDKAFELANVPLDATGLNEFGMGMKVSSIWLSNLWSVETTAYGEPIKKTVIFDLNEVVNDEKTELNVFENPCNAEDHYTIITLNKLSQNKPTTRQIQTIIKHLASIYTKFICNDILELVVNGEVVSDSVLNPLVAPYWKTPDQPAITWKKEFEFGPKNSKYHVRGFIGILEKMSTSIDNGFLLFRRNKVIGTSYDTKYRPKKLCGDVGSPRYKRIYGELELEGFSVSFTKNSFTQDADLETFIDGLYDFLIKDKSFKKIFEQAQKYTPTKTKAEKKDVANLLVNSIASGLSTPIVIAKPKIPIQEDLFEDPKDIKIATGPKPAIVTPEQSVNVGSEHFFLAIGAVEKNTTDPFYDIVMTEEGHYRSEINLKHQFFERFSSLVESEKDYEPISSIIKAMIITEIVMNKAKVKDSSVFRMKFNEIFGKV